MCGQTRLLTVLFMMTSLTLARRSPYVYNDVLPNEITPADEHDDQQLASSPAGGDTKDSTTDHQHCGCNLMTGPPGAPGVPGVPGMHGMRGQDGQRGEKGNAGQKGDSGPAGLVGIGGPIGPPGDKGRRGSDGPRGQPGVAGALGDKGQKGDRGFSGFAGLKGQKGEPSGRSVNSRVAFSVARSQKLGPVLQDTPVTFDVIFANVGDGFDVYSSHFVCRVNGTYLFTGHVLGQNGRDVFAWIMMNDRHRAPLHGDGRAGYGGGSQTVVLPLKRDDHVWIQLNKDSALLNDYTTFSGHLLFED